METVAPHAGAWIETEKTKSVEISQKRRPHTGA